MTRNSRQSLANYIPEIEAFCRRLRSERRRERSGNPESTPDTDMAATSGPTDLNGASRADIGSDSYEQRTDGGEHNPETRGQSPHIRNAPFVEERVSDHDRMPTPHGGSIPGMTHNPLFNANTFQPDNRNANLNQTYIGNPSTTSIDPNDAINQYQHMQALQTQLDNAMAALNLMHNRHQPYQQQQMPNPRAAPEQQHYFGFPANHQHNHDDDDDDMPERALRDYAMPTFGEGHSPIRTPHHNAEIRQASWTLLKDNAEYRGRTTDDPNSFLNEFLRVCCSTHINGVTADGVRLILFPYALKDRAKDWYESLPHDSLHTWEQVASTFLLKYFPPGMTLDRKQDISNFEQLDDERMFDTWG